MRNDKLTDEKTEREVEIKKFRERYMQGEQYFDFDKFKIICKKCGSDDVEFGGRTQLDSSSCYYPGEEPDYRTALICKCHACGNASKLTIKDIDDDGNSTQEDDWGGGRTMKDWRTKYKKQGDEFLLRYMSVNRITLWILIISNFLLWIKVLK